MQKTKKQRRRKRALIIALVLIILFSVLCIIFIDNKNIDYESFSFSYNNTDGEKGNIKIAHLSDLHFPQIKIDIDVLISTLIEEKIDLVAITGDIVDDSADIPESGVYSFLEKIIAVAPVYYANGNHEVRHKEKAQPLYEKMRSFGVNFLANESDKIIINGSEIIIIGLTDGNTYRKEYIDGFSYSKDTFKLLLAHKPEKIAGYINTESDYCPDLILSGHAHGGQFRFFGQGLLAPGQGLFPKYDSGQYDFQSLNQEKTVSLIVSRGLGNSAFPLRFNNKPHVPVITVSL